MTVRADCLWAVMARGAVRGALVGLAVVTSCSGVGGASGPPPGALDLAEAVEASPCGGGDVRAMEPDVVDELRRGFEAWPLPPVFVSAVDLGGDAVACFDGKAVLVHDEHADDRVILAHEWCHAIAYLLDRTAPLGFPSPEPKSPRALALEPEVWHQEIWAVTCATAVTGLEDWSWGHLVHDSTARARRWAAQFVAHGPALPLDAPRHWSLPRVPPAQQRPDGGR